MPFIVSKVNVAVTEEQELALKTRLGKAIERIPGKSEEYLLLSFESNCHLYLRGDNSRPIAYITASIFGNEDHAGFSQFAAPEKANVFLTALRHAIVQDCRPATHIDEILNVVRRTEIDEAAFLQSFQDGSADAALETDLAFSECYYKAWRYVDINISFA